MALTHQAAAAALAAFQEEHRALDAALLEHQGALLDRDAVRARASFAAFAARLEAHAAFEEEHVLPAYEALGDPEPGAAPEFFHAEHGKLRRLLAGLAADLERLAARGGALAPAEAIALLEREFTLRHLLDHHTQREDRALYPRLARELALADLARLARSIAAR